MYDELIKRLRDEAEAERYLLPHSDNGTAALLDEAADAIEELSKDRDKWKATAQEERDAYRHWFDQYQKDVSRWIPVTERLPEHGWYLAYGPTIKMEVLHFHIVEEVWSSERYYNIEVTHWMPLPEPPQEE